MREHNPVTLFWVNFAFALVHVIALLSFIEDIYYGDEVFLTTWGIPLWAVWILMVFNGVLGVHRILGTIRCYRIIKFGVKATWKD